MFRTLTARQPDGIVLIMQAFAADDRPDKIDLGVGVYRDTMGNTPVFAAVKAAERRLVETQTSKGYVAPAGDPRFLQAMRALVLGDGVEPARVAALATPGGSGALQKAMELVALARPEARLWLPDPTWPNHPPMVERSGLQRLVYRYFDRAAGGLDRAGMWRDLAGLRPGDVVLVHGCCHNPTGTDLTPEDWQALAHRITEAGALPLVDLAYLGLGQGLDADATGLRLLARRCPEMLVATSCSKNFGLYRDRVGLLLAVTETPRDQAEVQRSLAWLNRVSIAFPPDHGAAVVTEILADPGMTAAWRTELETMRSRIGTLRRDFAAALQTETGSNRFAAFAEQVGMFSLLPATPDQIAALRQDHAIYVIGDGRINLAGLTDATIGPAARAIASVLG
ncbi:amino acid aminotransferase [Tropicimonas sp. IMCC34043]|uniref:amino acid aminotransferase n=1 Tax=Tropicimonas sp. IMCC34043 TaxID=2248760 RepID=UPI000E27430D|nr:amino acid aminotransferase [Tropicimonas sp. IMCC34043]